MEDFLVPKPYEELKAGCVEWIGFSILFQRGHVGNRSARTSHGMLVIRLGDPRMTAGASLISNIFRFGNSMRRQGSERGHRRRAVSSHHRPSANHCQQTKDEDEASSD